MIDHAPVSAAKNEGSLIDTEISNSERDILRRLAGKVAELSLRPSEDEKRDLWYRHNDLEPTRPLIFCDPENGWNEIVTPEQIECKSILARQWEAILRKEIFWGESMGDDRVVEPYFNIYYVHTNTGWGIAHKVIGGENGGSYVWDSPVKDYEDIKKLRFPEIVVDHHLTEQLFGLAQEIIGDLLEVRVKGRWRWTLGLTQELVYLRGLEQMMVDMYENPTWIHEIMAFLRDGQMRLLDYLENNNLLTLDNDGTYVGSGGFGFTQQLPGPDFAGKVRNIDLWGFAESQETTSVSPTMFEEFVFKYQLPLLERFGLNCYGCCEPIDKRWHVVKQIPRLRRVSVSPWSDLRAMAEILGDRYIYSMKPNPAALAEPDIDDDYIRRGLREALQIVDDCRVEIIMKDNHTIGRNPENVKRWCRIAREEIESAMG